MIEVSWNGSVLTVEGHAPADPRVCAAISAVVGTLFVSYGANKPGNGFFSWDASTTLNTDVPEFVLNLVRTLCRQYPESIQLIEAETRAA